MKILSPADGHLGSVLDRRDDEAFNFDEGSKTFNLCIT